MIAVAKDVDDQDPLVEELESLLGSFKVKYGDASLYTFIMTKLIAEMDKIDAKDTAFEIDGRLINMTIDISTDENSERKINKEKLLEKIYGQGIEDAEELDQLITIGKCLGSELIVIAELCPKVLQLSDKLYNAKTRAIQKAMEKLAE